MPAQASIPERLTHQPTYLQAFLATDSHSAARGRNQRGNGTRMKPMERIFTDDYRAGQREPQKKEEEPRETRQGTKRLRELTA